MSVAQLSKAKAKLMLEHPYFATMLGALELTPELRIATTQYGADRLTYNPEYLEMLTTEETMSVLAHAAMTQALYHTQRSSGRRDHLWQVASSYAINDLLVQNGFSLPPMAHYSSRFERLYTEQIYAILLSENAEEPETEETEKEAREEQADPSPEERLLTDEAYALLVEQVIAKLEKQGTLPRGLERLIPQAKSPQLSWRELLYRYVTSHARSDYRMFPSNKKHLYRGVALPSVYGEELQIAVAVDTSASVDEETLGLFLAELEGIVQLFPHYMIELIECDAKIQHLQTLTPTEPLIATLHGGGGTDFRPVFAYLEETGARWKFLIYFTDGEGSFPDTIPTIDTLWVLSQAQEVPFGERIVIEKT